MTLGQQIYAEQVGAIDHSVSMRPQIDTCEHQRCIDAARTFRCRRQAAATATADRRDHRERRRQQPIAPLNRSGTSGSQFGASRGRFIPPDAQTDHCSLPCRPELRDHYVRVTPTGAKSFVTLDPNGEQVWAIIGGCDAISLATARERAREAMQRIKEGLDSGAKRNALKRSGFERPFQARQARPGTAS
jgi:hypothetical protein